MYHKKTNNILYAQPTSTTMVSSLYDLWLSFPVNSYGHIGTLPPFYGTSTHEDVMTPLKYQLSKYNVTAQLISAFVFATRIVQFFFS